MVFVERTGELAELSAAYSAARAGSPVTVLVTGDAGIGKTRLVEAFAATVPVLVGRCLDVGVPFAPFAAALRDGLWEPGLARPRLFERVLEVLRQRAPVALVVEDVHHADRSTRDLLTFLVANQRAAPGLLVVVTCRSDLARDHPARRLVADLAGVGRVRRLEVGPLTRQGVTALLRARLGREPGADVVANVHARSEGNPLFVEALLACIGQPGSAVPPPVRDLLLAPLARLPVESQTAVRAVAVAGGRVGHELLTAVTGLREDVLRPAVSAGLVVVDGDGYRFRHALVREMVYDDLLPGERSSLHVRYAMNVGASAPDRARHWLAVAGKYPVEALAAAWRAAGPEMLGEVLRLWPLVPDAAAVLGVSRSSVLHAALRAATGAGDVAWASTLVEELLSDGVSAELLLRRGELRHALGRPGGLDDVRAAAAMVPASDPLAATVLATLTQQLLTVPCTEEARATARAAAHAARRSGDTRTEAMATADLAYLDGDLPGLSRPTTDELELLHVLRRRADLLQDVGRYPEAAAVAREGLAACAAAGLSRTAGPVHAANLAEALIAVGDWDEAVATAENALGHPAVPGPDAYLLVLLGSVRLARGDLDGAAAAVAHARSVFARGYPDSQDLLPVARLEIDLRLAQGRVEEAVSVLRDSLDLTASPRYLWPVLASGARIPATVERVREVADRLPVTGPVQEAHRLMVLGSWTLAASAWAALGDPYQEALAASRAPDGLRRAAELCDRLDALPLRAEVDRLATLTRVRLAPEPDRFGLTGRELQVLRLLATGRTNREIATELFISAKTVSTHVSNILTKLDVSGRLQAATVAMSHGILT